DHRPGAGAQAGDPLRRHHARRRNAVRPLRDGARRARGGYQGIVGTGQCPVPTESPRPPAAHVPPRLAITTTAADRERRGAQHAERDPAAAAPAPVVVLLEAGARAESAEG